MTPPRDYSERRRLATAARAERFRKKERLANVGLAFGCLVATCWAAFWLFVVATVVYAALHFVWGM